MTYKQASKLVIDTNFEIRRYEALQHRHKILSGQINVLLGYTHKNKDACAVSSLSFNTTSGDGSGSTFDAFINGGLNDKDVAAALLPLFQAKIAEIEVQMKEIFEPEEK